MDTRSTNHPGAGSHAHALLTRAGDSRHERPLAIGPDTWCVQVAAADTAGALSVMAWDGHAPGGPPLHLHPDQDEVFIVEAGQYHFQCGADHFDLVAGDTIFLPRGVPHTFCQRSAQGRLRYLYTPAGQMEDFFVALSQLPSPPPLADAQRVFEAHGMRVVGPPLPLA
jgi:quercetin 2,3-dioxygenase